MISYQYANGRKRSALVSSFVDTYRREETRSCSNMSDVLNMFAEMEAYAPIARKNAQFQQAIDVVMAAAAREEFLRDRIVELLKKHPSIETRAISLIAGVSPQTVEEWLRP